MEIVKFKDGTYGIRRDCFLIPGVPSYEFLDKRDAYWWTKGEYKNHFAFDTIEKAKTRLEQISAVVVKVEDYGEPITA